jgi:hypothetical protein
MTGNDISRISHGQAGLHVALSFDGYFCFTLFVLVAPK